MSGSAIQDALVAVLPPLLGTLDVLEHIGRFLAHPIDPDLIAKLGDLDTRLKAADETLRAEEWPDKAAAFQACLTSACLYTLRAADGLRTAHEQDNPMFAAGRALRQTGRALEQLYGLAPYLAPVGRFFLEPSRREDEALMARLRSTNEGTGVLHAGNDIGQRGGFSVYIPEYLDRSKPAPVVFALHGGAGHGRLFLWNWVREARTRGVIVVAPTARGDTWSLMDPETDSQNLAGILENVGRHVAIDPKRRLLTGMSDGGTFTLLSGIDGVSPFTHLAPVAASFHPMLVVAADHARLQNLPIYLTHGALDWMFPVTVGRTAHKTLEMAGAAVVYREIPDLAHTYPRDENPAILDWFLG